MKDRKLYPVMNNAILQSEKTAYTRDEFNRQEFFRGVANMCKTRIQNNMKRKEVIV
jgi:hypothetical protein